MPLGVACGASFVGPLRFVILGLRLSSPAKLADLEPGEHPYRKDIIPLLGNGTLMPTIDSASLSKFTERLVAATGASQSVAEQMGRSLVGADLRGHHSHGVRRMPAKYYPEVGMGRIDPTAEPELREHTPLSATIDGKLAYGQVVGREATDAAVERAADHGVGLVGLRNVSHIGRVGEWAERAADSDMLFVAFVCNPGSQYVAPAGSADRRLSTNPIALGSPSFGELPFPLVLDIATSQVAHGKIRHRAASRSEMPEEWVATQSGESLRDAHAFEEGEGAMLPLGGFTAGHKGFGLSVMSELLASIVSDGCTSGQDDDVWGNQAMFVAVDPTVHTSVEKNRERVRDFAAYLRATDYSAPFPAGDVARGDTALLPGEAEHARLAERREAGVPISDADAALLRELAAELGVDVPSAFRD